VRVATPSNTDETKTRKTPPSGSRYFVGSDYRGREKNKTTTREEERMIKLIIIALIAMTAGFVIGYWWEKKRLQKGGN